MKETLVLLVALILNVNLYAQKIDVFSRPLRSEPSRDFDVLAFAAEATSTDDLRRQPALYLCHQG